MLRTEEHGNQRRRRETHTDGPEDIPQYLIDAAKALIDATLRDRRKHTDGADQAVDPDTLGVHFTPLDIVGTCGREAWLIVLTDDESLTVMASTCVLSERDMGAGADVLD